MGRFGRRFDIGDLNGRRFNGFGPLATVGELPHDLHRLDEGVRGGGVDMRVNVCYRGRAWGRAWGRARDLKRTTKAHNGVDLGQRHSPHGPC